MVMVGGVGPTASQGDGFLCCGCMRRVLGADGRSCDGMLALGSLFHPGVADDVLN